MQQVASAYIKLLQEQPELHDKIEFEVAFTIWTPDICDIAAKRFEKFGVTDEDIRLLSAGLKKITKNALTRLSSDLELIGELSRRRALIESSSATEIDKAFHLLEDCKTFGTLAFAHAARAGFVARAMLDYLVRSGGIKKKRIDEFQKSFLTVTGLFEGAKQEFYSGNASLEDLISKFGHLRPGTYEVEKEAYWEKPDQYFNITTKKISTAGAQKFKFNSNERQAIQCLLADLGAVLTIDQLTDYLIEATQQREAIKLEFTKGVSRALDLLWSYMANYNLPRQDVSFITYTDLKDIKINNIPIEIVIGRIKDRKNKYKFTELAHLPPVITKQSDFYCFEQHLSTPNYIGSARVISKVVETLESPDQLAGNIALIRNADPGFDWIFGLNIAALVTQYGGANSHMAIRAAELNLPAVIGVGDKLYDSLREAEMVEIDCSSHIIRVIMKILGLTQRVVLDAQYGECRDCIDLRWYELARSLGFEPVGLPNVGKMPAAYFEKFQMDALILTGGNTLSRYAKPTEQYSRERRF